MASLGGVSNNSSVAVAQIYDNGNISERRKNTDSERSTVSGATAGIQLPEDQVTLSGKRPEKNQADTTSPANDTLKPGEKESPDGRSLEDPAVKAQIAQLKQNEEQVKSHEAAHKSVGGSLSGAASYSYTQGPDGRNYISGGEVQINMSSGRTPQETISRMQQVIRAALAPADPSGQDRAVAAQAAAQMATAQQEKLQTEDPASKPKPGESVDPSQEAVRKAQEPAGQQPDTRQAGAAADEPAAGSAPERSAARNSANLQPSARSTGTLPPSQQNGNRADGSRNISPDLINQAQRAYADPAVQGQGDERQSNGSSASFDAASSLGLFGLQPRSVSAYA